MFGAHNTQVGHLLTSTTLEVKGLGKEYSTEEHTPTMDQLVNQLHESATNGERKRAKKILKRGVSVDVPNHVGQTALYLACSTGHLGLVELFLQHGANPNVRCCDEVTPMHVASMSGNINIMVMMVGAGGDLRLHDKHNRSVQEWSFFNPDERKRKKFTMNFEEEVQKSY